jgi:signal transduction histidine kinase
MSALRNTWPWRYGVAVLLTGLTTGVPILLHQNLSHGVMALLMASVMVSAWYGGLGPGLLASVLSVLSSDYFFFPPIYSLAVESGDDIAQIIVFSMVTVLISSLTHAEKKALRELVESKERLQEYAEAVWEQHRRFASELHDSLGQELTGLGFLSKGLSKETEGTPAAAAAYKIKEGVQRALEQIRGLAKGVMPVEHQADGLMAALQQLTQSVSSSFGIPCRLASSGPVLLDDHTSASQLYRIAQEAVTNAMKHAHPQSVIVSLTRNGEGITLQVVDDGIGIPEGAGSSDRGSGLSIMKYRAAALGATLRVERIPRAGTAVTCFLPVRSPAG